MKVIGLLIVLLGIVLGIYYGFYVMFIGGILQIIHACKADIIVDSMIIWGVVKILFSGIVGGGIAWFVSAIGVVISDLES